MLVSNMKLIGHTSSIIGDLREIDGDYNPLSGVVEEQSLFFNVLSLLLVPVYLFIPIEFLSRFL